MVDFNGGLDGEGHDRPSDKTDLLDNKQSTKDTHVDSSGTVQQLVKDKKTNSIP